MGEWIPEATAGSESAGPARPNTRAMIDITLARRTESAESRGEMITR